MHEHLVLLHNDVSWRTMIWKAPKSNASIKICLTAQVVAVVVMISMLILIMHDAKRHLGRS